MGCGGTASGPEDGPGPGSAGSDAHAVDAPADGPACGLRGGPRGHTTRTIDAGGLIRTYEVYLPAGAATEPMPLVFVHHGYSMSGQQMLDITNYTALADTEHIALVFPDGQGGASSLAAPWNVGAGVCSSSGGPPPVATGDDFAMLDAIEADLARDQCLDLAHVFVTGFSMGGYFAHHAGCMRPEVRAIAPHSGGTHDLAGCTNTRRPVIIFHGKADPVVPPGCDDPGSLAVFGSQPSATAWAAHNGCSTTTSTRTIVGGSCLHYEGCPPGGQVELCTFDAMGHCWAGGAATSWVYACPLYASATQLEWQFWKTYAW